MTWKAYNSANRILFTHKTNHELANHAQLAGPFGVRPKVEERLQPYNAIMITGANSIRLNSPRKKDAASIGPFFFFTAC